MAEGNALDFLGVQMGLDGRAVGALADTFFFRNGTLIMIDENGLYWRLTIIDNGDGTGSLGLSQVTI